MKLELQPLLFVLFFPVLVDCSSGEESPAPVGGGAPTIETPTNTRTRADTTCHTPGEELAEGAVRATCLDLPIREAADADAHCDDGPRPFGELVFAPGTPGLSVCGGGPDGPGGKGAEREVNAGTLPYAVAIALQGADGKASMYVLSLAVQGSSYQYGCWPIGFNTPGASKVGSGADDLEGKVLCGGISVARADGKSPPLLRVVNGSSSVLVEMLPTGL